MPIKSWLQRRRERREERETIWRPYAIRHADGTNQLQIEFENDLRQRAGSTVQIDREVEHDCDGKDVLWLTIQPSGVEIAIHERLIQVGGRYFYDDRDGNPPEIIMSASEKAISVARGGT